MHKCSCNIPVDGLMIPPTNNMAPIFSDSVRTCLFEVGGEGGQKQRNKFVFYVFLKKGKLLLFEVDVLWNTF